MVNMHWVKHSARSGSGDSTNKFEDTALQVLLDDDDAQTQHQLGAAFQSAQWTIQNV